VNRNHLKEAFSLKLVVLNIELTSWW